MSAITIEHDNIKISLGSVEQDGWMVLTLLPDAYLILRADKVKDYSAEKLREIAGALRGISKEPEMPSYYHPSKARALKELRARGITNISGGEEYGLKPSSIPLEQVQQELASIKGSLADDIIAMREER